MARGYDGRAGMGYTPEQGDVVVLTKPFENITGPIVKRIIAVGGQTVEIDYAQYDLCGWRGDPSDYILEPMEQKSWQTISTITVPEGRSL
ncbi:MAG: S26 family signal peptidase [Flavonifractor plautii]